MLSKFLRASVWLAWAFAGVQARGETAIHGRPIVIFVTIDGFPARALNPSLPMPTLLQLAKSGALAEGMIPINPTVTWPNHTTLVTGVDAARHHVMANGLLELSPASTEVRTKPEADKSVLVHGQTLYDAAVEHGLTTGQVDWVAVAGAKNIAWEFQEKPTLDSPVVQEMIRDDKLTVDDVQHFGSRSPAWRDQIWTDAAIDILQKHTPDLLLVHLLETDTLQHKYGPLSPAAYAAYAYADHCLGRIVAAVQQAGLSERVTYIIASDHGFSSFHHMVRPGVFLKEHGLRESGDNAEQGVWAKAEGGHADVFVRGKDRVERTARLAHQFAAMPGVEHVYSNSEAQRLGISSTSATSQAPDLWITAAPDYAFEDGVDGAVEHDVMMGGQHGYPNTNPEMYALFVASGASIRPGIHMAAFPNVQVAPTIARILGLSLPEAQAAPLSQILR